MTLKTLSKPERILRMMVGAVFRNDHVSKKSEILAKTDY